MDFAVRVDHIVKLQKSEKKVKYLELTRELKNNVEYESDGYTICNWCSWYSHQKIGRWTGAFGNMRISGCNPKYNIPEIGQNTENSPGDLRRLLVTQAPVKDYQLTLIWNTLKE